MSKNAFYKHVFTSHVFYVIHYLRRHHHHTSYQVSHPGIDERVGAVGDEEAGLAGGLQFVEVLKQRVTA